MYSILSQILGRNPGIIIAGFKPIGATKPEPHQFNTVTELVEWATPLIPKGDLFYCPMRRGPKNPRNQWSGLGSDYLWVDIDWQNVPPQKQDRVDRALRKLGAITVASGSIRNWRTNVHVYVRLSQTIDVKRHTALNEALRNYLWPKLDGKYADNSLLRIPDTENHKTAIPNQVRVINESDRRLNVDKLEAFLKPAQRRVETRTRSLRRVDVAGVPRFLTRMAIDLNHNQIRGMLSRPGVDRSDVWWLVLCKLVEWRGPNGEQLTDDQIYSVMAECPLTDDIRAEKPSWNIHKQIDKRLAQA